VDLCLVWFVDKGLTCDNNNNNNNNNSMQNGDKVVYSKYAGTELKVEGADYVLLKVQTPHDMDYARAASCLAIICSRKNQSLCTDTPHTAYLQTVACVSKVVGYVNRA